MQAADAGAPQGSQVATATEHLADVLGKSADIRPLAAINVEFYAISFERAQIKRVYRHGARGPFQFDPLPGIFVKWAAVALEGGMHGRHLQDVATEAGEHRFKLFARHRHRPGFQNPALRIRGIGAHTEPDGRGIALVRGEQFPGKLGRLAEAERQQPGSHRVERAGMSGLGGIEQAPDLLQGGVGGHAGRLVEQQDAVDPATRRFARTVHSKRKRGGVSSRACGRKQWPRR